MDDPQGKQPDRIVTVQGDQSASRIRLEFEDGHGELLAPVGIASSHLFGDAEHAWRFGANRSVLTDVETIDTYACTPIEPATR